MSRARLMPPWRAVLLLVVRFAPSTSDTVPRTPTSSTRIAISTSTRVKPAGSAAPAAAEPGTRINYGIGRPRTDLSAIAAGRQVADPQLWRTPRARSKARCAEPSKARRRAGARLLENVVQVDRLPGAAVRAAARVLLVAAAGRDAGVVLRNRELGSRLRSGKNRVRVSGRSRDRDGRRKTGGRAIDLAGSNRSALVILLVRVAGLDLRHHVARVRLSRRVLALLLLAKEGRQGDRGKDADDQDDNEELDQREAALLGLNTLTELPQHCCSSWGHLRSRQTRGGSPSGNADAAAPCCQPAGGSG